MVILLAIYVYRYLLCSRSDLKQHDVWISEQCVGAVPLFSFLSNPLVMIDMLMMWLIHWVWFIYIIIYISWRCVFKETLDVPLKMLHFSAWGTFIFPKQTKSDLLTDMRLNCSAGRRSKPTKASRTLEKPTFAYACVFLIRCVSL